jgi:serine/threonine-protein kinase HipA
MIDRDQDLHSLLKLALDKSVEGREQLTARIAQLSLEREHMLSDQERDLIFDILDKLIHEFETPIRKRLADRLSRNPAAPRALIVALANDDFTVAQPVLLLQRFDREGARRIPFLSAMSMLGARDNQTRSYLEIVDALRQHGAAPRDDIQALWRRMVYTILISNTDDHLRNHGFLYEGQAGWRLSPAYDLNPVPVDIKPRILSTAVNEDDATASLALAMGVAGYFELTDREAQAIGGATGRAVATWRTQAALHGLSKAAIDRMASAFEHDDLKAACAY